MEQAIRDMGNYGVKLRKPEKLPDFDQPSDYEEEKNRFEPIKMDEDDEEEALSEEPLTAEEKRERILEEALKRMAEDGTTGIPSRRTAMFDPSDDEDASEEKIISSEKIKTGTEEVSRQVGKSKTKGKDREDLARFQGKYLRPFRNSHRKAVYVSEETNEDWTSWCGKSVSRERAFQDTWNKCFGNTSTNTRRMWKDGGNSEPLHSSNANPCRVTAFTECSNTAGAYQPLS